MKAVIPAAGLGTRLLPLSSEKVKALFPVVNRPIIDIIINNLKTAGVDSTGINLHHLPRQIPAHLEEGRRFDIKIHYQYEKEILDTGGGLASFADYIGEQQNFIVHNCDILTNIDLQKAFRLHEDLSPLVTLVTVDNPPKNTVLIDKYGRVKDIAGIIGRRQEKGDRLLCGAGIFIYSNSIFDVLPKQMHPYPLIPKLIKHLKKNPGSIVAWTPEEGFYWKDMGNVVNYIDAHRDILTKRKVSFHGIHHPESGIWMDREALIEKDAELQSFISAGRNSVIGSGSRLKDCILWEGAMVPSGTELKNAVITPSGVVNG